MKILTVIGARPQFIKAATVSRVVAGLDDVNEIIVHTGQHYDANMSDIFFEELSIPKPNYHLGIGSGTHGAMTGRQLEAIEEVMIKEQPDFVLVYGDTNSTLAGALSAVKLHIPIAHVEAGLRSFNRRMPEEINRILTDHASNLLFAPTETAMTNLSNEGISNDQVHLVGDVMYDAALFYQDRAQQPSWYNSLPIDEGNFVLATIHRAENTDDKKKLISIFEGLSQSERPVILPLHPRTRSCLKDHDITLTENLFLVEPVSYLEMVWLEMNCSLIATDSGGVQKEAYFHDKPCITLRDETEWVELVDSGWNTLVGSDSKKIASMLASANISKKQSSFYGDGNAAGIVVEKIGQFQ